MAAVASTLVPAETAAVATDLWALSYLLKADWSGGMVLRSAYATDISPAVSDGEQRRGLLGKPQRLLECDLKSMDQGLLLGLQAAMDRMGSAKTLGPLYCDQSTATLAVGALDTVINCDISYRRFTTGARIAVFNPDTGAFAAGIVQALAVGTITLTAPIGAAMPVGCLVFPLMECRLNLETSGEILAESVIRFKVTFAELPGPWSLDTGQGIGSVPGGFDSYLGYPILSTPYDYNRAMSTTVRRSGNYVATGVSQHVDIQGDRPRRLFKVPYTFGDRASAWLHFRFFHGRGGRLFPFWVASPTNDYQIVAFTAGGVQVRAVAAEIDWLTRPYIALVKADGTVQIRTITNVVRAGTVDTLTLDSVFDSTGPQVRLTTARLMRNNSDELAEEWLTDSVAQTQQEFLEVVRESDVTIEGIVDPDVEPLTGFFSASSGAESSGVICPMYYWPCPAPSERPLGRAADLLMPSQIQVRANTSSLEIDPGFPFSGDVSDGLLAALRETFALQYDGAISGTSRHWAHTIISSPGTFSHLNPGVTRHRWRATKEYVGDSGIDTLTVDFIAEWNGDQDGAAGAIFNIYFYSTEVNEAWNESIPVDGFLFTKEDPVVLDGTTKRMHPQMLLMASVPTSWSAACSNVGVPCDYNVDPQPRNGFASCWEVPNSAPWHANNATNALGSSAFLFRRDPGFGDSFPARAVSLGGDCPVSTVFGHLIIENSLAEGRTALTPTTEKGWDEEAGTLDVMGGSAVDLIVCYPAQTRINCCDSNLSHLFGGSGGNPSCWRAPPDSPASCDPAIEVEEGDPSRVCCFPTDSIATVNVTQRCLTSLFCETTINASGEATKQYILSPCRVDYWANGESEDSQDQRVFKWAALYKMPEFDFLDVSDNFNLGNSLGFVPEQGTWSYPGAIAHSESSGGFGHIDRLAMYNGTQYINGVASVDCLSSEIMGLVVRTAGGNPDDGYGVLVDPATPGNATISIYKFTGSGKTLIAQTTALTITVPYRLEVQFEGSSLRAEVDDDPDLVCAVTDCTYWAAGYVGMIVESAGDADFDNFEIIDNNPAGYAEVYALYNSGGFYLVVPPSVMPVKYNNPCPSDVPEGCARATNLCPQEINHSWGGLCVSMPDQPIPPGLADCKCDPDDLIGFRCATLRIDNTCLPVECPAGSVNQCNGIDVYNGIYNP